MDTSKKTPLPCGRGVFLFSLFQTLAIEVGGAGVYGDLRHHHAVAVVVEVDLGHTGQGKIKAGAEYVVGDVHNAAEDGQTRTVVGE